MAKQTRDGKLWASVYWYARQYVRERPQGNYQDFLEYVYDRAGAEVAEVAFTSRAYEYFSRISSRLALDLGV